MASNIKWALGAACHQTARPPSINCPCSVPDDVSYLPLSPQTSSSLTADGLRRGREAIRVPSRAHGRTSVPASSAFSPVLMRRLCVRLSRTSLRPGFLVLSPPLHHSPQQEAAFPEKQTKTSRSPSLHERLPCLCDPYSRSRLKN